MKQHAHIALVCLAAALAGAQEPKPATPPTQPPTQPPAEPTLDDLLGLPRKPDAPRPETPKPDTPDAPAPAEPAPPVDPAKNELDRQLSPDEQKDDFALAVELMGESAQRLNDARDAGLDTQRLQKQALDKLDKLIDQARRQKSKSKSKSKSQNSDPQNQDQNQPQSSQAQQQQQQQQQANANANGGNIPANESGKLNPPPGAGAAWGQLPDRLRDALMQGSSDTVSSRWEALTREYYKRLAESPSKPGGAP